MSTYDTQLAQYSRNRGLPYMEPQGIQQMEAIDQDIIAPSGAMDAAGIAQGISVGIDTVTDIYGMYQGLTASPEMVTRGYSAYDMPSQIDLGAARNVYNATPSATESAFSYGAQGAKTGGTLGMAVGGPIGAAIGTGIGAIGGAIAGGLSGKRQKEEAAAQERLLKEQASAENRRYQESLMTERMRSARAAAVRPTAYNAGRAGYSIYM